MSKRFEDSRAEFDRQWRLVGRWTWLFGAVVSVLVLAMAAAVVVGTVLLWRHFG